MLYKITLNNIEYCLDEIIGNSNIDLSGLDWIEPIGLAAISLASKINQYEIVMPEKQSMCSYLDVMRMSSTSEHVSKGNTYVPLIDLRRGKSDKIAEKLTESILNNQPAFVQDEDLKKDFTDYLKYMILEILNNVIDHSQSKNTPVATAQFYPSSRKCQVAIVDSGVGFLSTLKKNYPFIENESEALVEAIQKEVTGAEPFLYGSITKNIGYGLYIISEIIKLTNGFMKIISNDGMLVIRNGNVKKTLLDFGWKGTIVAFELYSDNIVYDFQEISKIVMVPDDGTIEDVF